MAARSRPIGRGLAVAGQHQDVVGERQHLVARGSSIARGSRPGRSVRPIEPANSRSPESSVWRRCDVQADHCVRGTRQPEHHRARRVAGRVVDGDRRARRASAAAPSSSSATSSGSATAAGRRTSAAVSRAHALHRVGQQLPVGRVDVGRDASCAGHRDHREDVVEVTVGEQHRHRLEPVLAQQLVDVRARPRCPGSTTTHSSPAPGATT